MINLLFAFGLIVLILWVAKKFYFPTDMAQNPERYPVPLDPKVSKKELGMVMFHLQRWKKEGKISREEYDHLTDLCLSEMRQTPSPE